MSTKIALNGYYAVAFGALLVVLGLVLPVWSVYHRTQLGTARIEITGGPVRPATIILPPMNDGRAFAIAESEVTQGQFVRVMRSMSPAVASSTATSWEICPVPFNVSTIDMPVTCVTPFEAAAYANGLTLLENDVRTLRGEAILTICYEMKSSSFEPIPGCSGFRLPSTKEWIYAARSNTHALYAGTDDADALCAYANVPECPGDVHGLRFAMRDKYLPTPWHLYGMTGNASEFVVAGATWRFGGGSWRQSAHIEEVQAYKERSADLGFRVVRDSRSTSQ